MGDISAEPSMEEILSSIKRIIAEEGDGASSPRARRTPKPAPKLVDPIDSDEILELSEPVAEPEVQAQPHPPLLAQRIRQPAAAVTPPVEDKVVTPDPIVSPRAAEAIGGSLEALSRMIVKPETPGSDSLEGLVREMLKPMLRDWLDANLPNMVETIVAREIARITRGG